MAYVHAYDIVLLLLLPCVSASRVRLEGDKDRGAEVFVPHVRVFVARATANHASEVPEVTKGPAALERYRPSVPARELHPWITKPEEQPGIFPERKGDFSEFPGYSLALNEPPKPGTDEDDWEQRTKKAMLARRAGQHLMESNPEIRENSIHKAYGKKHPKKDIPGKTLKAQDKAKTAFQSSVLEPFAYSPLETTEKARLFQNATDPFGDMEEQLENDRLQERIMNVGKAIETLREEWPLMMTQAMTMSIFSEDVRLMDPRENVLVKGKKKYRAFFDGLMMARRMTNMSPVIEIKSLRHLDFRNEISMKFTITMEAPMGIGDPMTFDGIGVYKLNEQGLIVEHRIDDVTRMNLMSQVPVLPIPAIRNLFAGGRQPALMPAL